MLVFLIRRDGQRVVLAVVLAVVAHLAVIGLVETLRRPVHYTVPNETIEITTFFVSSGAEEEPAERAPAAEADSTEANTAVTTSAENANVATAAAGTTRHPPAESNVRDSAKRSVDDGEVQIAAATQPRTPSPAIYPDRLYVAPAYPERARRAGVEGTVVLGIMIDRRGRSDPELIESSGSELLDREAMRAVQLWRFDRELAGRRTVHRIEFTLEES